MAELTDNEKYIVSAVSVIGFLVLVIILVIIYLIVKVKATIKRVKKIIANGSNDDPLNRFAITRAKLDDSTYGSVPNRFAPRSNDNFDGVPKETQQTPSQSPINPQPPQIFPQRSNFSNQPLNYNQNSQSFGDNFVSDRENNNRQPQKFRTNQPPIDYNNKYY